jgi:hypothetical protein
MKTSHIKNASGIIKKVDSALASQLIAFHGAELSDLKSYDAQCRALEPAVIDKQKKENDDK